VTRFTVISALTTVALLLALVRKSARLGLAVVTAGMLAMMPLVEAGRDLVGSRRAVATMAHAIGGLMEPADALVHEGPIENSGALEFYSGHRPVLLDGRKSVLGIGATFPDAHDVFWDTERFTREWLAGERRLLLLSPWSSSSSVIGSLPPESVRVLRSENGRRLYDNQPGRMLPRGEPRSTDPLKRP